MKFKLYRFEKKKNKQRPKRCYGYRYNTGNNKYEIFTMNGGETYLATIESKGDRWFKESSEQFTTVDSCLNYFQDYYDNKKR